MKEWDLESYQRKYKPTITILQNTETGAKRQVYVRDVLEKDKFYVLVQTEQDFQELKLNKTEPIYYHFKSGYYHGNWLLYRRPVKVFTVGINNNSHVLRRLSPRGDFSTYSALDVWLTCDFLNGFPMKPNEVEESMKSQGRISTRFAVTKSSVYLMDFAVGTRDGNGDIQLADAYLPFHQELSDCLRGTQWRVK